MNAVLLKRMKSVIAVAIGLLLTGCATNNAYHTREPVAANCVDDSRSTQCKSSYLQQFADHTIAVAEFTERGNPHDEQRLLDILKYIEEKSVTTGVVTLVFVHGWKHNAQEDESRTDKNLADFKNVIAEIAKDDARASASGDSSFKLNGRALVGLYVGWRGQSLLFPKFVSYWERKSAAEQLGNSGLARLILELDRIDSNKPNNTLVTIGHSFGGAAVLSAVANPLLERLLEPVGNTQNGDPRCGGVSCGIGDGIYLLNPAIEANKVLPLFEATRARNYQSNQPPVLVSISTEADLANKILFPLGQTFGLLATSRQAPLMRQYLVKQNKDTPEQSQGPPLALEEEALDSTTVGNFAPFLTHRMEVPNLTSWCKSVRQEEQTDPVPLELNPFTRCVDYSAADNCGPKIFPRGFDTTPSGAMVSGRDVHNPLYFIRANKNFMDGHNDIFNEHVVAFLRTQLNQSLSFVNGGDSYSNALYQDPDAFRESYKESLKFSCQINFLE